VAQLQAYEQRRSDLRTEIENLKKQLEIAKSIVPEEKEVDEFMRILQGEASSAGVAIRRISSKPPSPRDYYVELPFEVEADGPYYSVLDFFSRLGRIPRVINVGDLTMNGYQEARGRKYPARPGTTVTGTFTATTFFTGGAQGPAPAAPAKGKQPGKQQPAKR
jgi:type IV pilus assembly protein PilO